MATEKKSYGEERMTQRSLINEYEPRRKIYGVFGIIDSDACPARGCRLQIGLNCSTGCPLKRNIRHNGGAITN